MTRKAPLVFMLLFTLLASVSGAFAHPGGTTAIIGGFEIEGNLADDSGAGDPIDWDTPPPNLTSFTDVAGSGDNIFGLGSKELEPGGWICKTGSAPGKDDIVAGQVAFRKFGGKQFVYVNFTRAAVNGDAHMDYEFHQSTDPNPSCPQTPVRTNGDIVITFDTENGGATIFVRAFQWQGTATIGTLVELSLGNHGVSFDGSVNIPNTIPGHSAGDFGEAALNLTDTIGEIGCGQFAGAYMKTRAATAINAALKDRTDSKPIDVGNCPNSDLHKAVRNVTTSGTFDTSATASPGDVIEYRLTYENHGDGAATNVTITEPVPVHSTFQSCSTSCATTGTSPGSIVTWKLGTVAPGGVRVVTFRVVLDSSFPSGQTQITNVATVDTDQEPPKESNPAVVTVSANANSELHKAVRNETSGGTFVTGTTADPGDVIEYRLTYHNHGNGDATGVVITDEVPDRSTFLSCSSGCTNSGTSPGSTITWNIGTVPGGGSVVVTFRVQLDSSFPAGTTVIANVATVDTDQEPPKDSNETTVTVTAAPIINFAKAANKGQASPGDTIIYTLTYSNTGNAPATGVVITEPVPGQTSFVSCTGGCTTDGPPVTTVTWNIGTVPAGGGGSVTLTVKVGALTSCLICNIATIDSAQTAPKQSNQVCVIAAPTPDPSKANAKGSAFGAKVVVPALSVNQTLTPVSTTRTGVGTTNKSAQQLDVDVPPPPPGSALRADVLRSQSNSKVTASPAQAVQTSTSETVNVNVLNGTVTASVVRAVAQTTASGTASSFSSTGSDIEGLVVSGVAVNDITPNQRIDLVGPAFGPGSYVMIYERVGATTRPPAGQLSGGKFTADLTVNMIHVKVTNNTLTPVNEAAEVIVSNAVAHSEFPQTTLCAAPRIQSVSGHAFILSESTNPSVLPLLFGLSQIPTTGGTSHQNLKSVSTSAASAGVSESDSQGTLGATASTASSWARAENVCLLVTAGVCTISAETVRSQANSTAGGSGATSNATGTQLVNVKVGTETLTNTPAPNTVIPILGVGFVILNEQFCDGGAALPTCTGSTSTGLTVRAIHVIVTVGTTAGAEIIVAEAHSDASFV